MTIPSSLKQRAKAVFLATLERESTEQQNQYLDEACADEPELRREVDALFESLKQADNFMENKAMGLLEQTAVHASPGVQAGEKIGPYKLLEEIGEGGMGSVWVAEQSKPLRRKVAIKLIKAGMDSKTVLARFEAERQALAMMDHPNIARVLDGGITQQGRPFFAMEYVKGVPLTKYCDETKLTVQQRLELFIPICKAVQHAHQKGIVHRDLKPSNILICLYDGKPVPKVIDFGLAKAMHQSLTEKTLYTAHGMMVGTPLYMSPEQAEQNNLDVDSRTDIYSLGVILYELLTGSTPLERASLKEAAAAELLRLIKEVDPPKPSTRLSRSESLPSVAAQRSIEPTHLARRLSGDLDWVVMKALEKERGRRYETANGLAEDIRRHLEDEPVSAGPPSNRYRMQKFVKRNRSSVIAGGAIAIALLLGVAGTTAGMFWALSEKSTAETERETAIGARQKAITSAELARQETSRAEKAQAIAERNRQQAEELRYAADIGLADAAVRENHLARGRILLRGLQEDGIVGESPSFEFRYLMQQAKGDHRDAIAGAIESSVMRIAVSPKNKILAILTGSEDVRIVDQISKTTLANIADENLEGVEFTADGSGLMLWSVRKRTLVIYDTQTWLERSRLTDILGPPSPDGRLIVRRLADEESARVYDILDQRDVGTVPAVANWMQVIEPGEWMLVAEEGNIWFLKGARLIRLSQPEEVVLAKSITATTAYSPDLRQFGIGENNGNLKVIDLTSGKTITQHAVVDHAPAAVDAVAISPDGTRVAAATWEPALRVCDLESGELWHLGRLESEVYSMAFDRDGRSLITGHKDGQIRIWDIQRTAEVTPTLVLPNPLQNIRVPVSSDGALLALSYRENPAAIGEIRIYDTNNLSVKSTIESNGFPLKFLDDGRQLVTIDKAEISFWDILSRKRLQRTSITPIESDRVPMGTVISHDGTCVVVPHRNDQIRIYNLKDGRLLYEINDVGLVRIEKVFALSRDNTQLAVEKNATSIDIYELDSGRRINTLSRHRQFLHSIEFTADGTGLIAGSHGDLLYWDLETGKSTELRGHKNNTVKAVAVSDDGQTAASLGKYFIKLWNMKTKRELVSIPWNTESRLANIRFEVDGNMLIAHDIIRKLNKPPQSRIQIWRNNPNVESTESK